MLSNPLRILPIFWKGKPLSSPHTAGEVIEANIWASEKVDSVSWRHTYLTVSSRN